MGKQPKELAHHGREPCWSSETIRKCKRWMRAFSKSWYRSIWARKEAVARAGICKSPKLSSTSSSANSSSESIKWARLWRRSCSKRVWMHTFISQKGAGNVARRRAGYPSSFGAKQGGFPPTHTLNRKIRTSEIRTCSVGTCTDSMFPVWTFLLNNYKIYCT